MKSNQDFANNLLEQKRFKEALHSYLEILQHEPNNGEAYQGIAQCYYHLRMYSDALAASNKAIEFDSTFAIPHLILGYIYADRGDIKKALTESKKAYDLAPEMEDVGNCYGALLLSNGRVEESISVLSYILKKHPASLLARHNLAVAYSKIRDYKSYAKQMELIFKSKPTLSNAMQLLVAYQQQYAIFLTIFILGSLLAAYIIRSKMLLILPAAFVVRSLLFDFKYIIEVQSKQNVEWKKFFLIFIFDCAVGVFIYLIFRALGTM